MNRNPSEKSQGMLAMAAAMSAPLAATASGTPWPTVLLVCIGGALLSAAAAKGSGEGKKGRLFWCLEWLWSLYVLSRVLLLLPKCWQVDGTSGWIMGAVLLGLAILGTADSTGQYRQQGSVLLRIMAVIYGVLLLAGFMGMKLSKVNSRLALPREGLLTAALVPAVFAFMGEKKSGWAKAGSTVFALLVSVCTYGILSAQGVAGQELPIYEAVRTVNLGGAVRRFEALLSVVLTMGWYSAISGIVCLQRRSWSEVVKKGENVGAVGGCAAAMGIAFLAQDAEGMLLDAGSVAAWVVLPILANLYEGFHAKKEKKRLDK